MTTVSSEDFGSDVINRLTVEWIKEHLTDEEWEILYLWSVENMTFTDIGKIVGEKYWGRELTESAMRYHRDKIKAKLSKFKDILI